MKNETKEITFEDVYDEALELAHNMSEESYCGTTYIEGSADLSNYLDVLSTITKMKHELNTEKTIDAEREKVKVGKGRALLEVFKTIVPPAMASIPFVLGLALAWNVEKDGRLNTRVSNLVLNQIPKIWRN